MAVYACSDLHGYLELYEQIKEYIQIEDKVYFLGDAADRGPQGWETIKAIFEDEQFIFIKGNHEQLLTNSMHDYLYPTGRPSKSFMILVQNGGSNTFDGWDEELCRGWWMNQMKALPSFITYKNIKGQTVLLSHAGFTPCWDAEAGKMAVPKESDLLWDIQHFKDAWNEEYFSNHIVVHGHISGKHIREKLGVQLDKSIPEPYWYCDGYKVSIDCCTYDSKSICLLNLDTWESMIFRMGENVKSY